MDEEQELKRLKQELNNQDITEEEYELRKIDIMERSQKLEGLKKSLKNKKISGAEYNKESYEIINRSKNEEAKIEEQSNKRDHENSRIRIYFKTIIAITIICATVFGVIGIFEAIRTSKISQHTITNINKENLPDPIQGLTSGEINLKIDDTDIRIEKLAKYTIYGKIVALQNYTLKNDIYAKLSPVDFTIAYGAGIEYAEKLNFSTNSDRMVVYRVKNENDQNWLNQSKKTIAEKITNNHLIHANNEIKDLLLQVRLGDYVKIEGFLVGVYSDKYQPWISSLSRDDTKSVYMNPSKELGWCEIIYVTDINWLE